MPSKIKQTQPETPNNSQGRDSFGTPNYAIDLLIPYIPKEVKKIWEPACGDLKITNRLKEKGFDVYSSDIKLDFKTYDPTYGNFITGYLPTWFKYEFNKEEFAIVTNPPFSLKRKFYERCIEYCVPFALLIPFDFNGWLCEAFEKHNCQALVPSRRINYITPSGKSELTGNTANFHSFWLTKGFSLPKQITIVELSLKDKENI